MNLSRKVRQLMELFARDRIADADNRAMFDEGDRQAIRRDGQTTDAVAKFAHQLARGHIPEEDFLVIPCRNQRLAVRQEGEGVDPGHAPLQATEALACGRIPQMDGGRGAGRGDDFAVGRNGNRIDGAALAKAQRPQAGEGPIG